MSDPNLDKTVVFREPTQQELQAAGLSDRGLLPPWPIMVIGGIAVALGITWVCIQPTPMQYTRVDPSAGTAQGGASVNDTRGCEAVPPGGGTSCKAPNGEICACAPNTTNYLPR